MKPLFLKNTTLNSITQRKQKISLIFQKQHNQPIYMQQKHFEGLNTSFLYYLKLYQVENCVYWKIYLSLQTKKHDLCKFID